MTRDRELYLQTRQGIREKNRELWYSRWNVLRGLLMGVAFTLAVYGLVIWRWGGENGIY